MKEFILFYQESIGVTIDALACKIHNLASTVANNIAAHRIKNPETLRKKMLRKGTNDIFAIHDVYGIRVLVDSTDSAYEVLKAIQTVFPMYLANDFIKNPIVLLDPGFEGKSFKCLRIVAFENNIPFEIQITTHEFNVINESHHDVYHKKLYS